MMDLAISAMIAAYFAVFYLLASVKFRTTPVPMDGSDVHLLVLVVVFASTPFVFNIDRQSGTAVLEEGMTASNMLSVSITLTTAVYLAWKVLHHPRIARLPFAEPYLPFTLMLLFNVATTAWSIVPSYTCYRSFELLIFYFAAVILFDEARDLGRTARILATFIACWIVAVLLGGVTGAAKPSLPENLANGILFSCAKNNMMPLVCIALALLLVADRKMKHRGGYAALAAGGFIAAGSAASTGALVGIVPALMMSSKRQKLRLTGVVLGAVALAGYMMLVLGLSNAPFLVDALSVILQKPAIEITNATGRTVFWPTFLAATEGKVFGSGFSAADRFIQLLIPAETLAREMGLKELRIASAHNMFLSAWAGSGVVGLSFTVVVIASAMRYAFRASMPIRRVVLSFIAVLVLNGMTTPGIFYDWNVNIVAFVAVLAVARRDVYAAHLAHRDSACSEPAALHGAEPRSGLTQLGRI